MSEIDDALREQAALYALDALPADEAAKFRQLVRRHPDLAGLVAEYEAAGQLFTALTPPATPPPALRSRILAQVAHRAPIRPAALVIPWGIAAALAVTAAFLWNQNLRLDDTRTALEERASSLPALEARIAGYERLEEEKNQTVLDLRRKLEDLEKRRTLAEMQVATLTSKLDASYLAAIAWDNDAQEGILKVRRLPATERGKEYQLWVIDPARPVPVSGGVFKVADDGSATIHFAPTQKVSKATAFAVSLEKTGGVPVREGPVVISNL